MYYSVFHLWDVWCYFSHRNVRSRGLGVLDECFVGWGGFWFGK
jgi:hypothetical protein